MESEHRHSMPITDWEEIKRRLKVAPTTAELERIAWIHKIVAKSDKVKSDRQKIEKLVKMPKDKLKLAFSPKDQYGYSDYWNTPYIGHMHEYNPPWVKIDSPLVLDIVSSYKQGLVKLRNLEEQYKTYKRDSDTEHREEISMIQDKFRNKVDRVEKEAADKVWWARGICTAIVVATIITVVIL